MTPTKIAHVLLAEDDPGDVRLTQESLKHSRLHIQLSVVSNGVEVMQFLRQQAPYQDATLPDLILLDLNMPKKDGRETLREIKQDAQLKQIPVVVLTTSDADMDILKSYKLGCNCYVKKPVDFAAFREVISSIENFWFSIVKLPPQS